MDGWPDSNLDQDARQDFGRNNGPLGILVGGGPRGGGLWGLKEEGKAIKCRQRNGVSKRF